MLFTVGLLARELNDAKGQGPRVPAAAGRHSRLYARLLGGE